jgi:hypothetical protein
MTSRIIPFLSITAVTTHTFIAKSSLLSADVDVGAASTSAGELILNRIILSFLFSVLMASLFFQPASAQTANAPGRIEGQIVLVNVLPSEQV